MTDLTIKELHTILTELIEKGHGDSEFRLSYDSDCVYTTLPKSVDPLISFDYVTFSDYVPTTIKKRILWGFFTVPMI